MSRFLQVTVILLVFSSCATHPTISPVPLEPGESFFGYTFSTENVLPLIFYRYGLSDRWDLGLRVGLPVSGTGIDISRLLVDRDGRSDVLNLAYSLNPNQNIDLTYYRIKRRMSTRQEVSVQRLRYYGLRGMVILKGVSGGQSIRMGVLFGGGPPIRSKGEEPWSRFYRFQWEIGYFHDFNSMPLQALFSPRPFNDQHPLWKDQYRAYPHIVGSLPSEFSRLTGLSFRVSFPIGKSTPGGPASEEGEQ